MAWNQFAKQEMHRCGWSEGKGLGKGENGMKDAIKVSRKNNTGGLGHDQGTDFTFHWWDHVFNKAASSFDVSEDGEGVQIKKCEGKKITPYLISNKRPLSSNLANKSLLYGTFVKSGTYNSDANEKLSSSLTDNGTGGESSDDSDSDVADANDTLERTFRRTGLTGHKAARHGFNLSGKLQRINNQEEKQNPVSPPKQVTDLLPVKINESKEDGSLELKRKKKKKKKMCEMESNCNDSYLKLNKDNINEDGNKKKKKSKNCIETTLDLQVNEIDTEEMDNHIGNNENLKKKKKKKKKKSSAVEVSIENNQIEKDVVKLKNGKRKLKKENGNSDKDQPKEKKKKARKRNKEENKEKQ